MHPMGALGGAVLHRSPGHRLRQPAGGERFEVVQHRLNLGVGGAVITVPSDHPSAVPPHLVAGISQVSHQLRIPPQYLNVAAFQPGSVSLPEQVIDRGLRRAGAMPPKRHHHDTDTPATSSSRSSPAARWWSWASSTRSTTTST
jgi:hypothetical protein